jgi:hypothetical protein
MAASVVTVSAKARMDSKIGGLVWWFLICSCPVSNS